MRWPIRNQILLPLISVQLVVIVGVTGLWAWSSLRQVEQDIQQRFQGLIETIQQSTFPLTEAVLHQMRGLSGAEFAVLERPDRILTSTLRNVDADTFLKMLALTPSTEGDVLSEKEPVRLPASASPVEIDGFAYLSVRVPVTHQGRRADVLILYPAALVRSARRTALLTPVSLGGLALVLTTISGMVVAQHIGKRIQRIERQVARVAQGDFAPIPLGTPQDELRDLSGSVNRMSLQLEEMTRHIREVERTQLIRQLVGGIAHQLRNSLTGARLAIQLHHRRCLLSQEESLDVALRQLALTEEQIRGLVALIRDEYRPLMQGSLPALVQEVAGLVRPMCEHRQIRFQLLEASGNLMLSDVGQMRAALLNLCINAIEATTAGGVVEILCVIEGEQIVIEVRDDGPGISAALAKRMFEPFQTSKPDGMGLGLALVKQTADDLSGTVHYLREADRTIFRMVLPHTAISPDTQKPAEHIPHSSLGEQRASE